LKDLPNGEKVLVTNGNINCLSEQWFNTDYLIEPVLYKKNKDSKKIDKPIFASIAGNLCLEQDMITWRKIKFDYLPEPGDYLIYYNTAGYQMDSNESNFHKIPLVKKFVVEKSGNKYEIREDDKYDC
jgi:diaminopimelate decarboxylase